MRHLAALVFAFPLLTCAACAGETKPAPGQLMVVINTDMAPGPGGDFTHVGIEVLAGGTVQYRQQPEVDATLLTLPATLGVTQGADPDQAVTIRVWSESGSVLHGFREVVTTAPSDRVAAVHVPIEWLCLDAVSGEPNEPGSSCPAGETCIAGVCADRTLRVTDLPDFVEGEVFGGGASTGDGQCFDTVECFASAEFAEIRPSDCSVPAPSGDTVNVAIVLPPDTHGSCGDDACFIPLDRGAGPSAFEVSGGRVSLPSAVCHRYASGDALGVVVSGDCDNQKSQMLPTCGPWSTITGQRGTFDVPSPQLVVDAGF